ncbi:hypothetical protein [Pseudomonas tolaasii]|uniref:hypothetical protein n=1 Tax=Pseudomonas tolaasii TaxID=29442 RepID=UPI001E350512|nr:hypothetical protein [Pseudomonas tolaasii]
MTAIGAVPLLGIAGRFVLNRVDQLNSKLNIFQMKCSFLRFPAPAEAASQSIQAFILVADACNTPAAVTPDGENGRL